MGKTCDLSSFDRGMIVGARRAGSSVSVTAKLLGFSRTTVSRVYTEWCQKQKTSSQRQLCGRKRLVDERGQRRIAQMVESDRKATVTRITTLYNSGEQKRISERTAWRTLRRMGYKKRVQVLDDTHVQCKDEPTFHDSNHQATAVSMETRRHSDDDHSTEEPTE